MNVPLYRLTDGLDRRRAARPLPMVTLDFELDVPLDDGGALIDYAYFYVDFWLN